VQAAAAAPSNTNGSKVFPPKICGDVIMADGGGVALGSHLCNAPGCGNAAKLQCPTCLKNQLPQALPLSFFCSQTCFKAAWASHKVLHALPVSTWHAAAYRGVALTTHCQWRCA
jgi:hypothetical protein